MVGDKKYEIPIKYIKSFIEWNSGCLVDSSFHDRLFIEALLLIFVREEDLANYSISEPVQHFIIGNIKILIITYT